MQVSTFSTTRFDLKDWRTALDQPDTRHKLERALGGVLTPPVLTHLPEALALSPAPDALSHWITARAAESEVLTIHTKAGDLAGLVLLAPDPHETALESLHIGYLLAESVWGQGAATEVVTGLVQHLRTRAPIRLLAGVDRSNPASGRVLEKAGFQPDANLSPPGGTMYRLDIV